MKGFLPLTFLVLLMAMPAGAEVPSYTEVELQVRSNIVDGFNLPANSSFNSKTPSLNDSRQVSVCLSVIGGDTTVQGIWLGGEGQIGESQPDQIVVIDRVGNTTVVVEDQDSDGASPFVGFDNGVWLTENGRVAFVAEKAGGTRAVFLSDGVTTMEIASEDDVEVLEIEYFHAVANEAGVVAFRGKDGEGLQAVFAGDGTELVRVIGEHDVVPTDLGSGRIDQHDTSVVFGGAPAINANGDIAVSASLTPEDNNQVEWGSGIFVVVADTGIFSDGFESGDTTAW